MEPQEGRVAAGLGLPWPRGPGQDRGCVSETSLLDCLHKRVRAPAGFLDRTWVRGASWGGEVRRWTPASSDP